MPNGTTTFADTNVTFDVVKDGQGEAVWLETVAATTAVEETTGFQAIEY